MARSPLPPDVCLEIALESSADVVARLVVLSVATMITVRPLLYRDIRVSDNSDRLVETLASVEGLPLAVRSLEFAGSLCAHVNDDSWANVLTAMSNLHRLVIAHHIPLRWATIPHIKFRLHSFVSLGSIIGPWATFITKQPELRELGCYGDFYASAPGPAQLPVLRQVKARPEDCGKFARCHRLEHLWFWAGPPLGTRSLASRDLQRFCESPARLQTVQLSSQQLLMLIQAAPAILAPLRAVVLDEDTTWFSFSPEAPTGMLLPAVAALDGRTPYVESLKLVCAVSPVKKSPPLGFDRAADFASTLLEVRASPVLSTFHFCGAEGCGIWQNWGRDDETLTYTERDEVNPVYVK